ncbi:MAG: type II toxin-antitoxin system RelE/ParE family toxin [Neptuniibacter sp.]
MNISFSKSAIEDLKAIKEYYSEQGVPQIGQDFVAAIVEHIETLTTHHTLKLCAYSLAHIDTLNKAVNVRSNPAL